MGTRWDSEASAANLMQAYLGGTHEVRDPGGGAKQTHDFDVVLSDGRRIAVEVTRANVPEYLKSAAQIQKESWRFPNLRCLWLVSFVPGRSVKEAHRQLPGILERLEQQGIDRLDVREALSPRPSDDPWYEEPAEGLPNQDAEALLALGVLRVCNIGLEAEGTGEILMNEPPVVGATSSDVVTALATTIAMLPDNLAKLRAADATERHLFVWVESSRHHAVAAIGADWASGAPTRPAGRNRRRVVGHRIRAIPRLAVEPLGGLGRPRMVAAPGGIADLRGANRLATCRGVVPFP